MALSVVTLYRDILPGTNCKECGFKTCLAFASMVVSEKHPLRNCPYLAQDVLERCEKELEEQYRQGKWLKRDLAEDALAWAKKRASSMSVEDLPERIGGKIVTAEDGETGLKLPYFTGHVLIFGDRITWTDGSGLTRWEQVLLFNHLAQGGRVEPSGVWKGFVQFPNTVSKVMTMNGQVEEPLARHFSGRKRELIDKAMALGARPMPGEEGGADIAVVFTPLPKVPVALLFWDLITEENFEAKVKLMFDETVTEHLDIESIVFLSERIKQRLMDEEPGA